MTRLQKIGIGVAVVVVIGAAAAALRPRTPVVPPVPSPTLTADEARLVATVSDCSQKGSIASNGQFDASSRTWAFDVDPKQEFAKLGCHPSCIVSDVEQTAEIDWRCADGVTPPTGNETPTPTSTVPQPKPATKDDLIRVNVPLTNQTVKSPLTVSGEARGQWYFEASFPVQIYDANGKLLGSVPVRAQGDWMTQEYVAFKGVLTFATSTTPTGTLVFQKDNPSGLPQNANELRIPIRFSNVQATQPVKLFYYNPTKDTDVAGNVLCTAKGLVPVTRTIPKTSTPVQDTVRLLLKGDLTAAEREMGITTEFPLSGFDLKGASSKNGTLTLEFTDPQNKTSGGSCRVGVLWDQIEATAKQFGSATSVRFLPETLFQP